MRRVIPAVGLAMAVALLVAACGAAAPTGAPATPTNAPSTQASPPASPSTAAPSPSPTPAASKGPATAQVSLEGSNGLTGPVTTHRITCGGPTLDGPQIAVLGKAGTSGPDIVLFVRAGFIEARVATGSGQSLRLRSFTGTGVTAFDASTGVQLDSTLTETTEAGAAIGDLGALTRISGTLDCGDQQPGTSTVAVSGPAAQGQLAGPVTGSAVTCTVTASGTFVGISGLSMAGSTPVLLIVTASAGLIQLAVETKGAGGFYVGKGTSITTMIPGGARMSGDVTENAKTGVTPHMLHVEGSATCGVTINQ